MQYAERFLTLKQQEMALWNARRGAGVRLGWWRGLCGRAEVGVFWDLNRCGVVEGQAEMEVEASRIAPNIVQALRSSGFSGPVSIHAYGNTRSFSHHRFLQSLLATGVDLHHVPGGMKDLSNHLLLDLLLWMKETSPPAHMLLITGDQEYSSVMHKLHMRGYSVLLAHPEGDISPELLTAASKVWIWDRMMKGTEMVAQSCESGASPKNDYLPNMSHNHMEPKFSYNQDIQPELGVKSDSFSQDSKKIPHIPRKVVKQVVNIIRQRPSGFTVAAFRRQLGRSNVILDKDFYGHKDLLSFLLSVPRLKASVVWTSDKTRAYIFTEDLTGSRCVNDDNKRTLSARCDHNNDASSAEQETLQIEEEEKKYLGTRVEHVTGFQQLDKGSVKKERSKRSIVEKATSADFCVDSSAATSPGILSSGKNVFSTAWKKALLKLISLTKSWQFMDFKTAKTEMALPETASVGKGTENQLNKKDVDIEAHAGSATSQSLEGEGEKVVSAQLKSSNRIVEGDEFKLHKRVMHGDLKADSGSATLDGVQEHRERYLMKPCEVLATLEENEEQQPILEEAVSLKSQEKQYKLQNELDATPPSLQVGENAVLKEAPKNTVLTNQLCEDVIFYFLDDGRKSLITKATTTDDLLKLLMESNLESIAQLRLKELVQLAKILHHRILVNAHNQATCSTQSNAVGYESFSGLLPGKGTVSDSTATIPENHEGGSGQLGAMEKENGSKIDKNVLLAECRDDMYRNLKEMLLDLLQSSKSGLRLVVVKPEFMRRYGYELDNKSLGHPSLASLICTLEGLMISRINGERVIVYSSHAVPEGRKDGEKVEEVAIVDIDSSALKS
eukprot:c19786_g1_i1 orf=100-2622(-)